MTDDIIEQAKAHAQAAGIPWENYLPRLLDYLPSVAEVISEEYEGAQQVKPATERLTTAIEAAAQLREQPTIEATNAALNKQRERDNQIAILVEAVIRQLEDNK